MLLPRQSGQSHRALRVCQLSGSAQQRFIVTPALQLVEQVELISETGPKCHQKSL